MGGFPLPLCHCLRIAKVHVFMCRGYRPSLTTGVVCTCVYIYQTAVLFYSPIVKLLTCLACLHYSGEKLEFHPYVNIPLCENLCMYMYRHITYYSLHACTCLYRHARPVWVGTYCWRCSFSCFSVGELDGHVVFLCDGLYIGTPRAHDITMVSLRYDTLYGYL